MNQLSWFIYMADVLPGVASVTRVTCTLVAIFATIALILIGGLNAEITKMEWNFYRKLWFIPGALVVLAFIGNLVPQKETFYLIALSEGGEEVLKAPEFQKVRKVVNNWLDTQLKEQAQ